MKEIEATRCLQGDGREESGRTGLRVEKVPLSLTGFPDPSVALKVFMASQWNGAQMWCSQSGDPAAEAMVELGIKT